MAFIYSSEMWDISRLPLQTVHGLPACRSSIGPLRKANAASAFAPKAKSASSVLFMHNFQYGSALRRCPDKGSLGPGTALLGASPHL